MDIPGINLEWKTKLENALDTRLEDHDVNWRYIYNMVKSNDWLYFLRKSRNAEEASLALENIKGPIKYITDLGRSNSGNLFNKAIEDDDLDRFNVLLRDSRVKFSGEIDEMKTAIRHEFLEVIDILIDLKQYHRETLVGYLAYACEIGKIEIVNMLLNEYGIDPDDEESSAIVSACDGNDKEAAYEIVKMLLENKKVDPAVLENQAIINACASGNTRVVRLLLNDKRVDPSDQDNKAIINASKYNSEIVGMLLRDDRVDPSDQNNQAIINASASGNADSVELLLNDERVDPSDQSNEAIIAAAKEIYPEIVRMLLEDDRVDPSDQNNKAILGLKEKNERIGQYRKIRRLLDAGKITKKEYKTLLRELEDKKIEVISLLLNVQEVYDKLSVKDRKKFESMLGG